MTSEPNRTMTDLAITGIVQSVRNLDGALRFYRDLLGLSVLRRELTAAMLGPIGRDAVTLTLHEIGADASHDLNEIGPRQLWLAVHSPSELDRIEATLVAASHRAQRYRWPNADVLRMTDPDNVLLHIVCWSSGNSADRYRRIPTIVYARE